MHTLESCALNFVVTSPLSQLSGCLYCDVTWAIKSLYPMLMQCNIAEIYVGTSAIIIHQTYAKSDS